MTIQEYCKKHPRATIISKEQLEATILGDLKRGQMVKKINQRGKITELSLNSKEIQNYE
jgi:cell envelope opacity-associated protein A